MVAVRLGQEISDEIRMDRGLPQGAPESPLIFTMIIDMVICGLEQSWVEKGYGFSIDGFRLTAVCYADDILLAAGNRAHLEAMIEDVFENSSRSGSESVQRRATGRVRPLEKGRRSAERAARWRGKAHSLSWAPSWTSRATRGQRCCTTWHRQTRP